jgi:hypothetical protein
MATVKVESLRYHTYDAEERPEGTIYEADEQYVETLEGTGMARRVAVEPAAEPVAAEPIAPVSPPSHRRAGR